MGFVILGTLNNLCYVVVGSASKSMSEHFDALRLLGLIIWANVGFGFIVRSMNTLCLESVPYAFRVWANMAFLFLGLVGISAVNFFSIPYLFIVVIICVIIIGSTASFGESVFLAYLHNFPSTIVGGWSMGTGFAGVVGSLLYLILSIILVDGNGDPFNAIIFIIFLPACFIYIFTYIFIIKKPTKDEDCRGDHDSNSPPPMVINDPLSSHTQDDMDSLLLHDTVPIVHSTPTKDKVILHLSRYLRCIRKVWWISLHLGLVYFFEYYISVQGAAKGQVHHQYQSDGFLIKHAFAILSFCYQLGVLLSRFSLSLFKIKYIEILTVLQGINFILWILQDITKWAPIWLQFAHMIYVGLLGGAMYVNVFFLVLNNPAIQDEDRELCVNIVALSITAGITSAALFMLLYSP